MSIFFYNLLLTIIIFIDNYYIANLEISIIYQSIIWPILLGLLGITVWLFYLANKKQSLIFLEQFPIFKSEQQMKAIFNSSLDGMAIADDNGYYLEVNSAVCELLGTSPEKIIGKSIADFTDVGINFQEAWQDFQKKGRERGEFRIRRPDGTIRYVEYAAIANFIPHRHLSILRDITQRKQIEAELSQYRDRLEQLVELRTSELTKVNEQLKQEIFFRQQTEEKLRKNEAFLSEAQKVANVGSWELDLATKKLTFSAQTFRILALDPEMGEPSYAESLSLIYSDDRRKLLQAIQEAITDGKTYKFDMRIILPDGSIKYVFATGKPILKEAGKVERLFGTILDINERKQIEEALYRREQDFKALAENSPDIITRFNQELRHLYINPAIEKVTGISYQNFIGKNNRDLGWPEEKVFQWETTLRKAFETGKAQIISFDFTSFTGIIKYYQSRIVPEFSGDGAVESVLCVTRDITELKQVENALRESEERFKRIFFDAPIGMVVAKSDGELVQVNQAFCRMLGYSESELIGRNFKDITYPADLAKEVPYIEKCLNKELSYYQLEKRYVKKNGELLLINITCGVIPDLNTNTIYGLAMVEDIAERKEIERLKDEFISVVSHELRTPMTSLRGALGLISTGRLGTLTEPGERLLKFAIEDTDRLVRLINDILDLEYLKSGKISLNFQVYDAAELMQRVIYIMQPIANLATVNLLINPVPIKVFVDGDRIIQVLTNLVSNAIKFSLPNTTVYLTAQTQTKDNIALFQVKDRGKGIPEEKLEKIFDRFEQVDASDSRQKGGTGLGLAICRSIVEQHGGHIWVESRIGVGSTFYFTVPMQPLS
ncbi:MAG TPA: PAS domain S-box protein [Leptolyngbyaceae cyanobacterium]